MVRPECRIWEEMARSQEYLRCSTHDLEIERDRHRQNKKLAEERLCTKCTDKVVEDESHYLAYCTAYNALRSKYGYIDKNPVEIMNDINQNKLAIYLSKSSDLRKEITDSN